MKTQTYNGWTNYETWNVKLWIDNDEGSHDYWREETESAWKEHDGEDDMETRKDRAVSQLEKSLEAFHRENMPDTAGVYADLLGAALGAVSWREIALSMIDDMLESLED